MEAIPRGLVSRDMIKMIPGIKCLRTNILPSHHSGNHQFTSTASNKVTFQIPSFPNSYINTKRSFIRFVLKTSANGVLVPQANPFRRLLLKSSRGQVLEDIDNYDVLCRLFQNMKTKQTLEAEAVSTKDIRAVDVGKNFSKMTNASGQLAKHTLQSGILGDWQEYLVPVSSMVAASGYAFQLELFLNEDAKVVGSTNTNAATYSLEEVSFDVELVEVSDAIMADINSELANGAQIPLPYKSWRSHQTALSGAGTEHKIDISESAMNLTNMYSVLVPQSWPQKQSAPPLSISPRSTILTLFTAVARRSTRLVPSRTPQTTSISTSGNTAAHITLRLRLNWFLILLWRSRLLSRLSTSRTTSALSWRLSRTTRPIPSLASRRVISSSPTPSVSREIRASSRD